jgi:hypothetical protein
MIELNAREVAPSLPRDIKNAYFKGARLTRDNILWGLPLVALEAGSAQPGEQLPTLTGRVVGLAVQPAIAGFTSAAMVATLGCPPAAAAITASILAAYISTEIENPLIRGLSWVSKQGRDGRRVMFGGDYQDTLTAQKRRQRALRDIAGALPPARQWMGQEALILHR